MSTEGERGGTVLALGWQHRKKTQNKPHRQGGSVSFVFGVAFLPGVFDIPDPAEPCSQGRAGAVGQESFSELIFGISELRWAV